MTRRCGITLGDGQRVPVPVEKIGTVQSFLAQTGRRFQNTTEVHQFLNGVLPPGIIKQGSNFVAQQQAPA